MATLKTDHLSLMQRGRLDKVLAKRARYDGVERTLAEHVATLQGVKRESDGGCDFNRSRCNRMTGDEQRANAPIHAHAPGAELFNVNLPSDLAQRLHDGPIGLKTGPHIGAVNYAATLALMREAAQRLAKLETLAGAVLEAREAPHNDDSVTVSATIGDAIAKLAALKAEA